MENSIYKPVKITLEMHGVSYTVEGLDWDSDGTTLKDAFNRLLVSAGFPASIMDNEEGSWEYKPN